MDEDSHEHRLQITVDGTSYEAIGEPFGPAIHYSAKEVNVQVGGPLSTAIAAGKSVSLGDFDMIMNVFTNGIEPGDYALQPNRTRVSRAEDDRMGFAEIFFRAEAPFEHLKGLTGTMTIDSVDGKADGKSFRTERVKGHLKGSFRDESGAEHQVTGSFDYRR